jgi:hypothetical protein
MQPRCHRCPWVPSPAALPVVFKERFQGETCVMIICWTMTRCGVSKGEIIWFVLSHSFSLVHMWYKRKAPLNLLRIHKTQTCYSTYRNQTNWPHVNTKNFGCWRLIEAQTCSRWRWYSISGSPFGSLPFRPVFTYFCLTSFGRSSMFHFIAGRTATRTNAWGPTPNATKWMVLSILINSTLW